MSLQTRLSSFITAIGADIKALQTATVGGTIAAETYYEKYANGLLICRGYHAFPANIGVTQASTWTFGYEFVNGEEPFISMIANTGSASAVNLAVTSVTYQSVSLKCYRSTNTATGVYSQAIGRWK
jgi:hypothetical protein